MKRRVAVQTAPKKLEIVEEELPRLGPDDVLVHNVAIGLCHSDIPQYLGQSSMNGVDRFGRRFMNSPLKYPMYIGPRACRHRGGSRHKHQEPEAGRLCRRFYGRLCRLYHHRGTQMYSDP